MKCPACDFDLTEMEMGGVKLDTCHGGCGGIWFDAFELQRVDDRNEVATEYLLRIQRNPKKVVDFSRKRACPRCDGVKLKRHFFSALKKVEVDHCPNCGGYWLDAGELEKIRAEKALEAKVAEASVGTLSMDAIRFLYRQKLEQRPQA
jgi:Zn-finger nucleic acid-binding protein